MNLLELRKYAIDHRVEIRFGHTAHQCVINDRGLVKVPGENKDFRIEDALEAAQGFEIVGRAGVQHLTREAIIEIVARSFEKAGANAHAEEEE